MFRLAYNIDPFVENLTDFEKQQLPFALVQALNDAMYAVQAGWKEAIGRVFDRPTPLTRNAIRYTKATKTNLFAEVYFRDEASQGTPPATYLQAQVMGGPRAPKPFEQLLRQAGIMGSGEFALPARGTPLDAFGNLGPGRTRAILADLRAQRSDDQSAFSTAESRRKRRVRNRKREGQGVYFASRGPSGNRGDGSPQHLPRGVFERMTRGFTGPTRGGGKGVRMILAIVSQPAYAVRFDARALAQELFDRSFPTAFQIQFARAVLNAKPKGTRQ